MTRWMLGLGAMCLLACGVEQPGETGDERGATQSELKAGLCGPQRCGPALGMPAQICADGSVGGNTGRCIADPASLSCHWEIRKCPRPAVCDPAACGPAPLSPAYLCQDGSTGGNTGRCLPDRNGACHWEFRTCPPKPACDPTACGPQPLSPAYLCQDGSTGGNTGNCLPDPTTGTCHWEIRSCPVPPPPPACGPNACGPALGLAAIQCADGSIGGNTGKCLADPATAACHWEIRACP